MDMENVKSNKDEDLEKICIAFGMSKADLKIKLEWQEAYTSLMNNHKEPLLYHPKRTKNECNYDSAPRITPFVANSILIRSIAHTFIKSFHSKRK